MGPKGLYNPFTTIFHYSIYPYFSQTPFTKLYSLLCYHTLLIRVLHRRNLRPPPPILYRMRPKGLYHRFITLSNCSIYPYASQTPSTKLHSLLRRDALADKGAPLPRLAPPLYLTLYRMRPERLYYRFITLSDYSTSPHFSQTPFTKPRSLLRHDALAGEGALQSQFASSPPLVPHQELHHRFIALSDYSTHPYSPPTSSAKPYSLLCHGVTADEGTPLGSFHPDPFNTPSYAL